jgi:hypothetical protein
MRDRKWSSVLTRLIDLAPSALRIRRGRLEADDLVSKLLNKIESDQWNEQYRELLFKILKAQGKYIKLLERRIGK